MTLEDRARELADIAAGPQLPNGAHDPRLVKLIIAAFQAVRRQALEEAIQATRAAFKHGHETFGETAIRALLDAPSGGQNDI